MTTSGAARQPTVVERLPRRAGGGAEQKALPEPVVTALASIADDLRHAPRDVFLDRAELVHWLNRMARRADGVAAMTTPASKREFPSRTRHRHTDLARAVTPREVAEAVFGTAKPRPTRVPPRTIVSRKGRAVKVETRRGSAAGQMDLWS